MTATMYPQISRGDIYYADGLRRFVEKREQGWVMIDDSGDEQYYLGGTRAEASTRLARMVKEGYYSLESKVSTAAPTGNDDLGAGKQSNPKDVIGSRKVPFSVLPWRVLLRVALAMLEGAGKYGRHNYRAAGVRASVYFDAVVARHLTQWWEGEDLDIDSGLHHIDKAIAGLMVMRDSMLQGNFTDDRPPVGNLNMEEMNAHAARLIDKHADKAGKVKHWTIGDQL